MIHSPKIQDIENKVSFAIGTGRCGTHFLAEVIKMEPGVSSVHERNPLKPVPIYHYQSRPKFW